MYVDDLIITGNHDDHIAQVKKELHAGFKMTDLGLLHYYLGVEVFQRPHPIFIYQSKYAVEVLQRFGMQDCKPVLTPMEQNLKLSKFEGGERNHERATGMQPKEFFDISKEQKILVLFTKKTKIFVLGGYSDDDFAGSIDDRASTSGYLMNMGSAVVSRSCKKQATVAASSPEAEYISTWEEACEIVWLRRIL
eukprot:PITA_05379